VGEHGLVIGQGLAHVRQRLPEILEDGENGLSGLAREVLADLYQQIRELDARVAAYTAKLTRLYRTSPGCQTVGEVRGVGPLTATAMMASVDDGQAFTSGRQVSAWVSVLPRQASSGGKATLLGISKRGDTYLHTLLIHGARAVVKAAATKNDAQSRWINELVKRRNKNIAAVAVANKPVLSAVEGNARTIWALLRYGEAYREPVEVAA
jgi:transposase